MEATRQGVQNCHTAGGYGNRSYEVIRSSNWSRVNRGGNSGRLVVALFVAKNSPTRHSGHCCIQSCKVQPNAKTTTNIAHHSSPKGLFRFHEVRTKLIQHSGFRASSLDSVLHYPSSFSLLAHNSSNREHKQSNTQPQQCLRWANAGKFTLHGVRCPAWTTQALHHLPLPLLRSFVAFHR